MARDFRRIGDLTKVAMASQPSSDSIEQPPTILQPNSVTIGTDGRAKRALSVIGVPLGGSGSADMLMSTAPGLGPPLAAQDPNETDKAIVALLPPRVACCLKPEYTTRYSAGGADICLSKYKLSKPISIAEREAGISILEASCKPAPREEIVKLLTRLKLMTVSAAQSGDDLSFQLACYADELKNYPADVVGSVLRSQASISKFWPTWSELEPRLRAQAERRVKMLAALRMASALA